MGDKRDARVDDGFQALSSQRRPGFMSELGHFAMQTKKWWLVPLIVVLLGIGLIVVLGGTAAAPFIYTLF
jgi:hypothetical protein